MSIFKAYDIRGIYPDELSDDLAFKIGKAAAKHFQVDTIVVGSDRRISTDAVFENLTNGIRSMGVNVVNIGTVSTPILYWAVASGGYKLGAMITASHNPKEYNGVKFCKEGAAPAASEEIQVIRNLAENDPMPDAATRGTISEKAIIPDYTRYIIKYAHDIGEKKVVIDTGNAVCGEIIPQTYADVGFEIIPLYFDVDPTFPNHQPNPLDPKTLEDLQAKVLETGADLGAAFDGDGDRVFFVDDEANIISGDYVTLLIALSMIEDGEPNMTFLADCRCSWVVKEELEKKGARVILNRVGHTFIKATMREEDVVFGGELSGHFYYKENSYAESADATLFRMLRYINRKGMPLSQIIAPYRKYFQAGEINSEVDDKEAKMIEIERKYSDGKISHIDGVSIEFDDWWLNVRPSNTEPLLRLNLEARTLELMEQKRDEVLGIIRGE